MNHPLIGISNVAGATETMNTIRNMRSSTEGSRSSRGGAEGGCSFLILDKSNLGAVFGLDVFCHLKFTEED